MFEIFQIYLLGFVISLTGALAPGSTLVAIDCRRLDDQVESLSWEPLWQDSGLQISFD
jgi:hypothetical protein